MAPAPEEYETPRAAYSRVSQPIKCLIVSILSVSGEASTLERAARMAGGLNLLLGKDGYVTMYDFSTSLATVSSPANISYLSF